MTGSRGTSPETRQNENKTPLHAKQDHSEQGLLAQNIVSNRSTTVTNFWFESLIPSESPYFNKQHNIKVIHVHSQLHRPLREDSPIKSDHSREDREIIEFKQDDADHRQARSAKQQIQRGEGVAGIGDQIGRRRRRQQKRAGAAARDREQQHQRVDLARRGDADDDRDHNTRAGGVGGENSDDDHDHFDQKRRQILESHAFLDPLPRSDRPARSSSIRSTSPVRSAPRLRPARSRRRRAAPDPRAASSPCPRS